MLLQISMGEEEYNTKFKIVKEVRIAGDTEWKDKVTDVRKMM